MFKWTSYFSRQDVSRDMRICPTTYIEKFRTWIFPYIVINILDMNKT